MKLKINNNLPNELKIFSKVYKITYFEKLPNVDINSDSLVFGQTLFETSEIRIFCPKNYCLQEIWQTLFHEFIHVIKNSLNIDFENDDDEKIIDNLALGIMHTCYENKLDFSK